MRKAKLLFVTLGALLAACQSNSHTKNAVCERPNVVVIFTDDQGWADISATGLRERHAMRQFQAQVDAEYAGVPDSTGNGGGGQSPAPNPDTSGAAPRASARLSRKVRIKASVSWTAFSNASTASEYPPSTNFSFWSAVSSYSVAT